VEKSCELNRLDLHRVVAERAHVEEPHCAISLKLICAFTAIAIGGWLATRNMWFIWACGGYLVSSVTYDSYHRWSSLMETDSDKARRKAMELLDRLREKSRSPESGNGWGLLLFSPTFFVVGVGRVLDGDLEGGIAVLLCGVVFMLCGGLLVLVGRRRHREITALEITALETTALETTALESPRLR
jgi:hypothetical protein